jgi:hypothetical protein
MLVDMDYLHSVIADLHEAGFMDDAARLLLDAVLGYAMTAVADRGVPETMITAMIIFLDAMEVDMAMHARPTEEMVCTRDTALRLLGGTKDVHHAVLLCVQASFKDSRLDFDACVFCSHLAQYLCNAIEKWV